MTLDTAIKQLKDLRKDRESFIEDKEDYTDPFVKDTLAIDTAIEAMVECEQLRGMLKSTEGHIKLLLECCIESSSIRATTERLLKNLEEVTNNE